jgi:DNA polymerase elongation subunit (family B)
MSQTFYTFAGKHGNKILWRGYENGKPFLREVKYTPTLFLPTKETESEHVSLISKRPLKPKVFDTMSDASDFIEQYKDVNGFEVHGNSNFVAAFIYDQYPDKIDFDEQLINLFNYDIELDISSGMPDMEKCDKPISSIALKYRQSDKYVLLGQKHYDPQKTMTDVDPANIVYEQFDSEKSLLRRFVEIWTANYPEVITGWNVQYFDVWYTFTRIQLLFGENTLKRMSPWGIVKKSTKELYGKKQSTYDIMGISIVDYMDAFKKFGYKYGTQESYKLDHIAHTVLGESKLSYERFGNKIATHRFITDGAKGIRIPEDVADADLDEKEMLVRKRDQIADRLRLSPNDEKLSAMLEKYTRLADEAYHHFGLDYNLKDTRIVEMLEDATSLMSLVFAVAYRGGSNFKDAFGTVGIWDTTLYRKIRATGMVPPIKRTSGNESADYVGGYVKDPQLGLHDWVVSFDLNSLYPMLMIQYNMSPDTIVGNDIEVVQKHILQKAKDPSIIRYVNSDQFAQDFIRFGGEQVLTDQVPEMLHKTLIDANVTLTANRTVFDRDQQGIIPGIIDDYYAERSTIKKQMLSVESELERVKEEMKKRTLIKQEDQSEYRGDRKRYKL